MKIEVGVGINFELKAFQFESLIEKWRNERGNGEFVNINSSRKIVGELIKKLIVMVSLVYPEFIEGSNHEGVTRYVSHPSTSFDFAQDGILR